MSIIRPARCLFCSFSRSIRQPANLRQRQFVKRKFHAAAPLRAAERDGIDDDELGIDERPVKKLSEQQIKENFTEAQAESIRAAQKAWLENYNDQTMSRDDPWSPDYIDDFTQISPVIDKPVRQPWTNLDDNSRLKTEDEIDEDITKLMLSLPEDEQQAVEMWQEWDKNMRLTVGKEEAEFAPPSALAPTIPDEPKQSSGKSKGEGGKGNETKELSPALLRLMQMTGYKESQIRNLRVKTVVSHRVVNQTRLGKVMKMYHLSVAGNGNGLIGIGEGKSEPGGEGMMQSQYRAIRNMRPILRYENRTIFGDVKGKSGATELEIFARPPGFGLRVQQYIYEICKCAGINDLSARVTRARNPMNTVKATVQALMAQKDPEEIAKGRGKKLVDVRKVYYAGGV